MIIDDYVRKTLGEDSYQKGKKYNSKYVTLGEKIKLHSNMTALQFTVDSESYSTYYDVLIVMKDKKLFRCDCDCPQFYSKGTCKHIAACFIKYEQDIFDIPNDPLKISNEILSLFYEEKEIKHNLKEALNLDVELDFSGNNPIFSISIGTKRKYVIKNESKLTGFMEAYQNGENYKFGVNFTYDPNKHFLNSDDEDILKFLFGYKKNTGYYYYYRSSAFELSEREINALLEKLNNRKFSIKDYGIVNEIKKELPTKFSLDFKEKQYTLKLGDYDNYKFLDENFKYIAYNKTLYIVPNNYSKLLKLLNANNIDTLVFESKNIEVFKKGLLNDVKKDVEISENVTDIIISGKPTASIFLDLLRDKITCEIKFDYKGNIISYFDADNKVIRDDDYEHQLISKLLSCNFIIDKNKLILENLDDICNFIEIGLEELSKEYKVFTTKKIDNMNIIKKSSVRSNFSIGQDGIMSYNFSTDNINLQELNGVLSSIRLKKRYYKLKNGDIIDLNENKGLQELSNLVEDLNLNNVNLEEGIVEIPKYRALYIESLKNNKYKNITTDNTFDKFINNFKKYKNLKIEFDESDLNTLRDYQKDGVKWLYTLYKCDLGGILADEMGLGKSLQTICFIKQVLKEEPDAKIMIVCPTSLVYNWKKEFDKFAPDLKYVTVAESKEKRLEIINDFDKYNIFITSYGLIRNDNDEYEKINFELCVIDEAQTIKNYQANMTKEVKKIKAKTKIALTGTPLENSVLELWSIFDFIMPGYLNSIMKFRENYGIKDIDDESIERLTKLNYQIKPFILRRKKSEVSKELPDKIENNIYLELPDLQKALYTQEIKNTKEEMDEIIAIEGFTKARFKILQLLTRLRQICIDPSIMYDNYNGESIKLERLVEVVKDSILNGHKILVFSSFKRVINKVNDIFNKEGITSYVITGEVKSKTRIELVDKFNNDNTNCFLITLKSGGTGLNLTGADIVIHLDIWWNPQVENQATDRSHRIGQKNKVTVIKLVTKGTIEEKIIELQNKKKVLSENLIEGKSDTEILSSLSEKEMKNLLSYGEDE